MMRKPLISGAAWRRNSLVWLTVLGIGTGAAAGQEPPVAGVVIDFDTDAPLAGVVVELVDTAGTARASGLTGSRGNFVLRAPEAGQYRVSVAALGYRIAVSRWVEVGTEAPPPLTIRAHQEPLALGGIQVTAERRCGTTAGSSQLATVWEEARKGLMAISLADSTEFTYRLEFVERALDRDRGTILQERSTTRWARGIEPFRTGPPDTLLARGFIQEHGETTLYYGPDAALLLSGAFLDQYCFALVGTDTSTIGLEFEPAKLDRERSQIKGVLWVARATGAPHRLDFTYLNAPLRASRYEVGGTLEYDQLPTGGWIIRRWMIRAPQPMVSGAAVRVHSVGFVRESIGQVTEVAGRDFRLRLGPEPGQVSGAVVVLGDGTPLGNVLVYLNGTIYADTTDVDGAFTLSGVRPGRYTLAAYHGQLGATPFATTDVLVTADSTTTATLRGALPPVVAAGCSAGTGSAVRGRVYDASTGTSLGGALVELRRSEALNIVTPDLSPSDSLATLTNADGTFRFCGIAQGRYVLVSSNTWASSEPIPFDLPGDTAVAVNVPLTVSTSEGVPGRLLGRVVDAETNEPIAGATVRFDDVALVSDSNGRVLTEEIGPGTVSIRANVLGYADAQGVVRVASGQTLDVLIRMSTRPIELEPIVVTATSTRLSLGRMADFYQRLERGWGTYVLADEIDNRNVRKLTWILQEHGLRVYHNDAGLVNPRQRCAPMVYIDGIKTTYLPAPRTSWEAAVETADAVKLVHPSSVAAIEIYRGAAQVPATFGGSDARCGVIAIWTKGYGGT